MGENLRITEGISKQESETKTTKYKSIRIHPEDFEFLRAWAYHNNSTVVSGVSSLISEYKKTRLQEKKEAIEPMKFLNEEHKNIFIKYLEHFPEQANKNNNLVAFYANAAVDIFSDEMKQPFGWTGQWSIAKPELEPSEKFIALDTGKQQIINFARNLYYTPDENTVIKELIRIDPDFLLFAQEMLRLSLNGLAVGNGSLV
ncbi:hypothetical protein ACQKOM_25020 [Peribacillus frigoritolerans]|uniref:hypothetical protein n=1 Tax=Peribacillus frigoritolerans TaxID=450367 RepID=UPI003D082F79